MIHCRRSCTGRAPSGPRHRVQRPSLKKMPGSMHHIFVTTAQAVRRCGGRQGLLRASRSIPDSNSAQPEAENRMNEGKKPAACAARPASFGNGGNSHSVM